MTFYYSPPGRTRYDVMPKPKTGTKRSEHSARKAASPRGVPIPSPEEINALLALFKQGRDAELEALARAMTVRFPRHNFGWQALGAALMHQGRAADAEASPS